MITALLGRFRNYRKEKYFSSPLFNTRKKYGFIGVGMHSLTNLYPLIKHYGINLKYICTSSSSWENEMKKIFPGVIFTNNANDIYSDKETENVFISAASASHCKLIRENIAAGKNVFVEKPPCNSLEELKDLVSISRNAICKVGLQRRYWPANKFIRKKIKNAKTYTYLFHTGNYVDGDTLTGLFIHPLDYCIYLFGRAVVQSLSVNSDDAGKTIQLHLVHENGVTGLVECSSQHSWNTPVESLQINCTGELLNVQYPHFVGGEVKPARILNIPSERILKQPIKKREYFSVGNMILPVSENNTLYLQGFYKEVESFVMIAENPQEGMIKNDLPGLLNLYEIFDQVRSHKNY